MSNVAQQDAQGEMWTPDQVRSEFASVARNVRAVAHVVDAVCERVEEVGRALDAQFEDDEDAFDELLASLDDSSRTITDLAFIVMRAKRAMGGSWPAEPVETLSQLLGE